MNRSLRHITALLLAICMFLGVCGNEIAVFAQQQKTTYYVSLGDSMTNGLGMNSGYNEHNASGYLEVAYDAYPAQLSAWMAGYEGKISAGQTEYKGSKGTVKLTQLATSGMRAEDLHYILKYGQPGAYQGDAYMYTEVLQPGGGWNSAFAGGPAKVSQKFRDSIAEADIITVAVGNADFGSYLSGMISDVNGTGSSDMNYDECTLENALINAAPEFAALGRQLFDLAIGYLAELVPEEQARAMADRVGYVVTNYIYHYNEALDEIAQINPDAQIIIVGVSGILPDMEVDLMGADFAKLRQMVTEAINFYLSVLPARKQHQGGFDDITFRYAEPTASESVTAAPNAADHDMMTERIVEAMGQAPLDHTFDYTYLTKPGSRYLALGDATAYGPAANGLSQYLSAATANPVGFTNHTVKDQTALMLLEGLSSYSAQIEQADLISLGFSANSFTNFVVSQLKLVLANKPAQELDWEGQLGESAAEMIRNLMGTLKEQIVGSVGGGAVMGLDIGQVASIAIESYAYSFIVHMVNYTKLVDEIHTINPNAQILLVGMYNPMEGVLLNMGAEPMDMGEYLQYLVEICNTISKGKASAEGKCTFIDIPDVQTGAKPATYEMVPFFMDLLMKGAAKYNPSQAGYDYIRQQLQQALTVVDAGSYDGHIHEYYDWYVTKAPTSEEEGIRQRECVHCDHIEQLKLPAQTGPSAITSSVYTIGAATVSKITAGTTVERFLQGIGEGEYVKVYQNGAEVASGKKLGTGMELRLEVGGQTVQTLTVIVTGDSNGDGTITVTDMLAVKSHVLNKTKLSGVSLTAGDTNGDGTITITDFIQIKAQILGKGNVVPR